MTILSASPVQMLVHCVVKHSRPPDLKSSSNVTLTFAWVTGPATYPSFRLNSRHKKNIDQGFKDTQRSGSLQVFLHGGFCRGALTVLSQPKLWCQTSFHSPGNISNAPNRIKCKTSLVKPLKRQELYQSVLLTRIKLLQIRINT